MRWRQTAAGWGAALRSEETAGKRPIEENHFEKSSGTRRQRKGRPDHSVEAGNLRVENSHIPLLEEKDINGETRLSNSINKPVDETITPSNARPQSTSLINEVLAIRALPGKVKGMLNNACRGETSED